MSNCYLLSDPLPQSDFVGQPTLSSFNLFHHFQKIVISSVIRMVPGYSLQFDGHG